MQSPQQGPRGDRAWADLRVITERPHPWNSRNNDVVRDHILIEMKKGRISFPELAVSFLLILLMASVNGGDFSG
jgi:hypothetical protein